MSGRLAYLWLELASFLGVWLLSYGTFEWRSILCPRFVRLATALYAIWLTLDACAVAAGIWYFPSEGSLPIRLLGLPLEEHLFLVLHTVLTFILLSFLQARQQRKQ